MRTRPLALGLGAVTLATAALLLAAPAPTPVASRSAPTFAESASASSALIELGTLAVKGRAAKTGYSRAAFGPAWADVDRNGCDTRNDILNRDLVVLTRKPGTRGCVVLTGTLTDPYTGVRISFRRGPSTSAAVQVDHVVAMANAWQTGAAALTPAQRRRLANDPLELLAVDGPTNEAKGEADAATWLPPAKAYRCAYVTRQIAVKARYRLWVTAAEKAAMERVLSQCGGSGPVPTGSPSTVAPTPEVVYANCAAVRAAAAAPLHVGEPGYSRHLDRDGDGVACE